MAKTLQFRRGTTAELSSVTGAVGELFVDTTKDTLVVMDGSTAGGFPLALESAIPTTLTDLGITDGSNGQVLTTDGSGGFTFTTAAGGTADLSQIAEDVLPLFSEVYDIGSTDKRWYDVYVSNNLNINGANLTGSSDNVLSTTADVVVGSLLSDQLLLSDNMITPDDTTALQYLGDQGVVIINGNMDVHGSWIKSPVVETPTIFVGGVDVNFNSGTGFDSRPVVFDVQSDGKFLLGGELTNYNGTSINDIVRLNANGSIDGTFNTGTGFTGSISPYISAITVQPDDLILVGGNFDTYNGVNANNIVRLNSDGSTNNTFNTGTGFNSIPTHFRVQSDNKILVGGQFTSYNGTTANRIIRLNSGGSIDGTFNTGTGFTGSVVFMELQPDGKILVGATNNYNGTTVKRIIRLNSDGSIDGTFSLTGTEFDNAVNEIKLQADGKILAIGPFTSYDGATANRIIRLNSDGSIDGTFNTGTGFYNDGSFITVSGIEVQSDGKILVGGNWTSYNGTTANRIIRLNSDGSIDSTFDAGTGFNNRPTYIKLLSDNRIGLIGYFTSYKDITAGGFVILYTESVLTVSPTLLGETGMIRYNKDVPAFQGHNGTEWILLEPESTTPTVLADSGTVDIDFSGSIFKTQNTLTGDITYTGSSYLPGKTITIRVINGSTLRNLTFPTNWVFVGTKPSDIAVNKTGLLSITSFGTTEADCVASWNVES
jgi:uncharacterized delta-60 repeat protein